MKLQGLPLDATSVDVRRYFLGLTIPDGGVHILGGDEGIVFIEFASDEDARQAMSRGDGKIKGSNIKLLLSSRTEMVSLLDVARQLHQQYLQQMHSQIQTNNNNQIAHNNLQNNDSQQIGPNRQHSQHQQSVMINNHQSYLTPPSGSAPMGPALLPPSSQAQQDSSNNHSGNQLNHHHHNQSGPMMPFEGDPRMLSQNYQGILNQSNKAANQHGGQHHHQQNQQQHQQQQHLQQQQLLQQSSHQPPTTTQASLQQMPSSFIDPRILSQNYLGIMPDNQQSGQPQQLLLPQQGGMFNQYHHTPTTTSASLLGNMGLLGGLDMGALGGPGGVGGMNQLLAGQIGNLGLIPQVGMGGPNGLNPIDIQNSANTNNSNRNLSPDSRKGISSMRGGDDKLFANKRCVLAASNIPYRAASKDIIEFLSEFNLKEDCIRRRYNAKGQPTADAKIAFPSPDAAMKALKTMNKKTLCGRPVFLKPV